MNKAGLMEKLDQTLTVITDWNEKASRLYLKVKLMRRARADDLLRFMSSNLASGSVIYDVGAYVGMYSIVLANKVANSLVYAFEPNQDVFIRLVRNIRLMGLQDKIIPMNIALDEFCGKRTFYVSSAD